MAQFREALSSTSRIPLVFYDTSAILLQVKDKVPVLQQVVQIVGLHVPVVLDATIRELRQLTQQREWKTRRLAQFALNLIAQYFSVYYTGQEERQVDDLLVQLVPNLQRRGYSVYVVTSDLELRKRLEACGVKVLLFRESKRGLILTSEEE